MNRLFCCMSQEPQEKQELMSGRIVLLNVGQSNGMLKIKMMYIKNEDSAPGIIIATSGLIDEIDAMSIMNRLYLMYDIPKLPRTTVDVQAIVTRFNYAINKNTQ